MTKNTREIQQNMCR